VSLSRPKTCFRSGRVLGLVTLAVLPTVVGCGWRHPEADATAAIGRGDALVGQKRFSEAATEFRTAAQANPLDGETRRRLGEALWQSQQWDAAVAETIRAADLLPADVPLQVLASSRALTASRFTEAAARASAVLREQPNHVEATIVLANATAQLHDATWALYVLRTRASRAESFASALRDVRPRTSSVDDAKAERLFRAALALAPQAYETRVALVNFFWAVGRPHDAVDMLRQLADEYSADALLNGALGQYLSSIGQQVDAERYLKAAAAGGDLDNRLRLVDFYVSAGRDADALAVLDQLTGDDPPGSVSLPRAAIECRLGQSIVGLQRVDELLARLPTHGGALEQKASCLLGMGRVAEALPVARSAVLTEPRSARAHLSLGQALAASRLPEEAFVELTESVRLDPSYRPASKALAKQAVDIGRTDVAIELARELVRTDPTDETAAVTLVTALVRRKDYTAAAVALKTMTERFPASADLLVQQGDMHSALRAPGARMSYERALALRPNLLGAIAGLTRVDLAAKRSQTAQQRLEDLLRHDPNQLEYLLLLGEVLEVAGDDARSEASYRTVVAKEAGHVRASLRLSALLERQRRRAAARMVLERLLEHRPAAAEARLALATLLEEEGDLETAQSHYKKMLANDPRTPVAAYRLALAQAEGGENLDVALALAMTAIQVSPDDPGASDALGWIHVRRNLPRVGLKYLEGSVRAVPENPTYRYHLGVAYLAVGEPQKGRHELTRALALDPAFRFAPQARAALEAASR
jgi:tetratricopeptide (TPR) repeat protein